MSRFAGGGVCPRGALRAGLAVIFALAGAAAPATAFEFFDGRVSLHGFFETQIRSISKEFDTNDDVDLSQWYNILNLELEAEIAPDGIGPFDLVEAFVRVEARYDCVWKRACWLFPSVDTYGNRTEHLPKRLINGRLNGQHGALKTFDTRRYSGLNRENFTLAERDNGRASRSPLSFGQLPGIVQIFRAGDGANNAFEPTIDPNPNDRIFFSDTDFGDDTPFDLFDQYLRGCKWTAQRGKGGENGGLANPLGPWNPGCKIRHRRALNRFANPWNENDNIRTLAGPDRIPNTGDELPDPGK
nr:hypothetical protein [Myxococcota bacterium]